MTIDSIADLASLPREQVDAEIMKKAVLNELESINMFEQMAEMTKNPGTRSKLLEVIRDKRMHVGELQAELMRLGAGIEGLINR